MLSAGVAAASRSVNYSVQSEFRSFKQAVHATDNEVSFAAVLATHVAAQKISDLESYVPAIASSEVMTRIC